MGGQRIRLSYVLPDPGSYAAWEEFEGDLACMRQAGYDAVELQIADPVEFDEGRVHQALDRVGYSLCAFQTGSSYYTHGNCLCTRDDVVRRRTLGLLKSSVGLASRWKSVIVFGTLQGHLKDEPDHSAAAARIEAAISEIGRYATEKGVVVAYEPVNHLEVGFNNTIAEVAGLVRRLHLPGLKLMIDTFHMNIEERDMIAPIGDVADILAHVHLSETNRDVLGAGHLDTAAFLRELQRVHYGGYVSVGVYNTRLPRRQCIIRCMEALKEFLQ